MKYLVVLAGAAALAACGATETKDADVAATETEAAAEVASLNESSWTFTREGADYNESIDGSGNYIVNKGDEHSDHGTYEMIDGKHCFTSAMTDEGQVCWTTPATIAVGESAEVTSDAGETLAVTRQEYTPLTM